MGTPARTGESTPRAWDAGISLLATGAALFAPADLVLDLGRAVRLPVEALLTAAFAADSVVLRRRGAGAWAVAIALLAAAPLTLLPVPRVLGLLRLLMLGRASRLLRAWRFEAIERAALLRLVAFLYWALLLTHWVACGWIALRGAEAGAGAGATYIRALYWAVTTLATVGYGDITPVNDLQRIYAVVVMVLGVGFFGFVIGSVASILANLDPRRAGHLQRMEQISAFMAYRSLPGNLRERIGQYYRYLWKAHLDHDESEILNRLPPRLREDVALFLKRDLLHNVPLFRDASETFLREIALEMRSVVFLPGDHVIRAGERGREMYFVSRGSVEVLGPSGDQVLARLGPGDFFGEIALLDDVPRTANVRAVEYCDLYRLDKDLFNRVLAQFPEAAELIRKRAAERRARG